MVCYTGAVALTASAATLVVTGQAVHPDGAYIVIPMMAGWIALMCAVLSKG
jgi:hypothetical protein